MKQIRLLGLFAAAMLLQWWWTTHFLIAGLAPQILLVLTIGLSARLGPVKGMFFGFIWGLFIDVFSAHLFGANALALTIVAYGAGMARRQLDLVGLAPQCTVVFFMTWAYFLIIGFLGSMFLVPKAFLWVGWAPFIVDPFYNCLIAGLAYPFWRSLEVPR